MASLVKGSKIWYNAPCGYRIPGVVSQIKKVYTPPGAKPQYNIHFIVVKSTYIYERHEEWIAHGINAIQLRTEVFKPKQAKGQKHEHSHR